MLPLGASAQPYTWQHTLQKPAECVTFNPLSFGKTLFAASLADTGIFRSDDGGMSWAQYNDGLQPFSTSRIMQLYCLESDTNVVLAVSTSSGVFRSTNGGRKWSLVIENGGILGEAITWHRETDALYYGQNFMGPVWKSTDHGATWFESAGSTEDIVLCTIAIEPQPRKRILAGSGDGGIALSDEEGKNWRIVYPEEDPGELIRPEVPKIVWSEAMPSVVLATRWLSKENALVRSLDAGETWSTIKPAIPRSWGLEIDQRRDRIGAVGPERFWVGLFNRGLEPNNVSSVIETRDGGFTWLSTRIPTVEQVWMLKYDTSSNRLVAATNDGIYVALADPAAPLPNASVAEPIADDAPRFSNNPANEFTQLELAEGETLRSVQLMDVVGRLAYEYASATLDVRKLAPGAYMAVITTTKGVHQVSLMVMH
ncbi:MAG TPA: hypothetical protein VFH43_14665 [Candidatus Kapabacteria bacterium]|nr:hypothetical protein [Candidatus Kapabacteria bacterium]